MNVMRQAHAERQDGRNGLGTERRLRGVHIREKLISLTETGTYSSAERNDKHDKQASRT